LPANRANLFLKIQIELDEDQNAERIGEEICRHIKKMYGVRQAELSSVTSDEE
jgi:hypothetical protein